MNRKFLVLILVTAFMSLSIYGKNIEDSEIDKAQTVYQEKIEELYNESGVRNAECTANWYPLYQEARLEYIIPLKEYEEEKYVASMKKILEDYTVAKGFYHYKRLKPDQTRYFKDNNNIKCVRISVHVKLSY